MIRGHDTRALEEILMASRVLVIDRDGERRERVCAVLEEDGFVTVGVASYSEAVEQLFWSPADLAISQGFTSDGVRGVSRLHRSFPDLRFLVLSSGVAHELVSSADTHALLSFPKSCSLRGLTDAVHQLLTSREDTYLQEILDRGRLGFCMTLLH